MVIYEKIIATATVVIAIYNVILYKKFDKNNNKTQQLMFNNNRELNLLEIRKNTLNYIDLLYEIASPWNNFFESYNWDHRNLPQELEKMHFKTLAIFDKSKKYISDLHSEVYLLFEKTVISKEVVELNKQLIQLYETYNTIYMVLYNFILENTEKIKTAGYDGLNKLLVENVNGMELYLQQTKNYYVNLYAVKIIILEEIKQTIWIKEDK